MFTSGIRKIFTPPTECESLISAKGLADSCGCDSFCFNGDIYVKTTGGRVGRSWIKTPFTISDFKVNL